MDPAPPPPPAPRPDERSATIRQAPDPTGTAGELDEALGRTSVVGLFMFLPEFFLEPVLFKRMQQGARLLWGRDTQLEREALLVPQPGTSGPADVPEAWPLHEVVNASGMLARVEPGRPPHYVVRLERGDGRALVVVDPPKGLTRRLDKRGAVRPRTYGAAVTWALVAAWWAVLGVAAYRLLPWADFAAGVREILKRT